MKHLFILLLGFFLFVSLSSCSEDEKMSSIPMPDIEEPNGEDNATAGKILIVYFSRTGYENNARPSIRTTVENINDYDTIFVGSPIWHGSVPMIIRTFYESYNLTGKTIIPFSTHAGSGLGNCMGIAREYYPQGRVLDGLAVQGTNSANAKADVEAWLRRINAIE